MLKRLIACLVLVVTLFCLTGCDDRPCLILNNNGEKIVYEYENARTVFITDDKKRCLLFLTRDDMAYEVFLRDENLHSGFEEVATINIAGMHIVLMARK